MHMHACVCRGGGRARTLVHMANFVPVYGDVHFVKHRLLHFDLALGAAPEAVLLCYWLEEILRVVRGGKPYVYHKEQEECGRGRGGRKVGEGEEQM